MVDIFKSLPVIFWNLTTALWTMVTMLILRVVYRNQQNTRLKGQCHLLFLPLWIAKKHI